MVRIRIFLLSPPLSVCFGRVSCCPRLFRSRFLLPPSVSPYHHIQIAYDARRLVSAFTLFRIRGTTTQRPRRYSVFSLIVTLYGTMSFRMCLIGTRTWTRLLCANSWTRARFLNWLRHFKSGWRISLHPKGTREALPSWWSQVAQRMQPAAGGAGNILRSDSFWALMPWAVGADAPSVRRRSKPLRPRSTRFSSLK
jgi:hypothetical protein